MFERSEPSWKRGAISFLEPRNAPDLEIRENPVHVLLAEDL